MNYGFWSLVSLALAIILIFAEVFLPSGGIVSIFMVFSFFSAIYFAYQAWWEAAPVIFWAFTGFTLLAIPTSILFAFYWLERSSVGKRILLDAPPEKDVTPFSAEEDRLRKFIGRKTKTSTPLNPGGIVYVEGERIHCFTQGLMLDANQLVKITGVSGTLLIVEPTFPDDETIRSSLSDSLPHEDQNTQTQAETTSKKTSNDNLDFDFTESN